MKCSEVLWKKSVLKKEANYHRSDKIRNVWTEFCQLALLLKALLYLFEYYFRFRITFSKILFDVNQ